MIKILFSVYLIIFAAISTDLNGQIEIILRKSFIDSLKNRVTIESDFNIVIAHKRPNPISKDGDMHIAGTDKKIGLPIVAELMNANEEKIAMNLVKNYEGTTRIVKISGAWRIWCEHTSNESDANEQGKKFTIINSNPPHIFEIHPVTSIGSIDVIGSLKPIRNDQEEFDYKDAKKAFERYNKAKCKITEMKDKVKISTGGVGLNYAEFWIKITGKPIIVSDGRFIYCDVLDKDGRVLAENMRMAFPKNSEAEIKVRSLKENDVMHVIGIPRVGLRAISERVKSSVKNPELLNKNLPVEMIIVGYKK